MSARHLLVIGGGASGLSAAVRAAENGASVTLLERFRKPGRKLLATGNGRCNLANTGAPLYFGDAGFAVQTLDALPVNTMLETFERWGLHTVAEADGRVYPACGQAAAVLDVLLARARANGVQMVLDASVRALTFDGARFFARTEAGVEYAADGCILAFGGCAGGNLGCARNAYALAEAFGHTVSPLAPALAPLVTDKSAVRFLAGMRAPVIVTLMDGKAPVCAAQGEALFADYGVSGICVMQLARDAYLLEKRGAAPWLRVDFSPMLGLARRAFGRLDAFALEDHAADAREMLQARARVLPENELLLGLVPAQLAQRLSGARPDALPELLTAYPIPVRGVRSFENAQVTQGGVSCHEVSPQTMESRLMPGLFLTGEALDVDGDCGGYNLQFAFCSGMLAGESAARA